MEDNFEYQGPREFGIIEIFTISWNVFKGNYFKLFGVMFFFAVIIAGLNAIIYPLIENLIKDLTSEEFISSISNPNNVGNPFALFSKIFDKYKESIMMIYLFSFISVIVTLTYKVVFILSVDNILYQKEKLLKDIILNAIPVSFILLGNYIVLSILLGISAMLFIIPAIILGVFSFFMVTSTILNGTFITNSISDSFKLVKGRFGNTFALLFLSIIASVIVGLFIQLVFSLIGSSIVSVFLSTLATTIVGAYFYLIPYVAYINYKDTYSLYNPQIEE
jgi:hypothetical protein